MKDRVGTDRDADSLTRLFIHLGFYTNRYDNLKGKEMRGTLQVCTLYKFLIRVSRRVVCGHPSTNDCDTS